MRKYELRSASVEVRKFSDIKEGCTCSVDLQNQDYFLIKSYDDKEEALKELKKYNTTISTLSDHLGRYYLVEEFFVEENEYDEDGDWISGGDIWEFSKIK